MGLIFISGIGAHVNETVIRRNGFLPSVSDIAPTRGALRKDSNPCRKKPPVHITYGQNLKIMSKEYYAIILCLNFISLGHHK